MAAYAIRHGQSALLLEKLKRRNTSAQIALSGIARAAMTRTPRPTKRIARTYSRRAGKAQGWQETSATWTVPIGASATSRRGSALVSQGTGAKRAVRGAFSQ
jgi:hypothetical protein